MEFGYFTLSDNHYPNNPRSANQFVLEIREQAILADRIGLHSAWIGEHHFDSLGVNSRPDLLLANIASVTKNIRLAPAVTVLPLHHPVHVAEAWATLDVLSGGRVDMGLGAGWLEEDYTKTGVATWDEPEVRVSRLFESITVLRALFSGEPVTHAGRFYDVTDFVSHPKPVQDPVPLMIGGRGKRMLSFAARHAQIVSVLAGTSAGGSSVAAFEEQLQWIEDAGGRARTDLMVGIRVPFGAAALEGESTRDVAERFGAMGRMSADDAIASPFVLVGDHAAIVDQVVEVQERYGVSYITVSEGFGWQIGPVLEQLSD